MIMRPGDSWHCTNSACQPELSLETASQGDGVYPRCRCGSAMKKRYRSPLFRCLDSLQVEDEKVAEPAPCRKKED